MAELGSTNVHGDLRATGNATVDETLDVGKDVKVNGELKEKGQRVFSPNNLNASSSVTSNNETVFANSLAVKKVNDKAEFILSLGPFKRADNFKLFNRYSISGSKNYLTPKSSVASDGDWFSVRAENGEPVINSQDNAKFKRLADGEIDSSVKIVLDDRNERFFVYNEANNEWEF